MRLKYNAFKERIHIINSSKRYALHPTESGPQKNSGKIVTLKQLYTFRRLFSIHRTAYN